jgi:response regulator of citrate/malate metabolism
MIRTLVVDDDFRVAQIHADRVSRVEGFVCVGSARSAAAARVAIKELKPDLLLLDIYLPDEDGLSLLRSIQSMENAPDCVIVTAARDLSTVRAAMRSGAIYYLVKPFGFEQLRRELETYRRWRTQLNQSGAVDQAGVDSLYEILHGPTAESSRGRVHPTMQKVLDTVRASPRPVGAAEIAVSLGMSRPTAQRYLTDLERRGAVELKLEYGATGRPVNWYVARRRA